MRIFFSEGSSIPVIANVLHVTLVYNTGAAFGMFKGRSYLFVVIAVFAAIFISILLIKRAAEMMRSERMALCFILGGTLGNLIDRFFLGHVVDFIDFRIWPVFNVADSFITMGSIMLVWSFIVKGNSPDES